MRYRPAVHLPYTVPHPAVRYSLTVSATSGRKACPGPTGTDRLINPYRLGPVRYRSYTVRFVHSRCFCRSAPFASFSLMAVARRTDFGQTGQPGNICPYWSYLGMWATRGGTPPVGTPAAVRPRTACHCWHQDGGGVYDEIGTFTGRSGHSGGGCTGSTVWDVCTIPYVIDSLTVLALFLTTKESLIDF